MRLSSFLLITTMLLHGVFAAAQPPTPLTPYVAEYEFLRSGSPAGHSTIRLESAGPGIWRLHSHTRGTQGLAALAGIEVTEISEFSADAAGLSCDSYRYRQTGLRKRERQVDCGVDKNGIVSQDHRGQYRFASQSHVLDRQTVSLALAIDLAAGKKRTLSYPVVDRDRLETQKYTVRGTETVEVPAGSIRAVKVERTHGDGKRKTTTWFGVDQGWVPVRVQQSNTAGEGFELRLISLKR